MTQAYPLQWPNGRPRTKYPKRAAFQTSRSTAVAALMHELNLLGARDIVLSSNLMLKNDGLPYAKQPRTDDEGIAVYFTYKGNQTCFACDRWDLSKDNIQAIRKTIEALRGISRWGTGDMMEAAFKGFTALPAPIKMPTRWQEVLGFASTPTRFIDAHNAFKELAKKAHPDNGGTSEKMAQLNKALADAKAYFGTEF